MTSITLHLDDADALDRVWKEQIAKGRLFVPVAEPGAFEERTSCEVILTVAAVRHVLEGEVVFVRAEEPGRGVGLAMPRLDDAGEEALRSFVELVRATEGSDAAPEAGAKDESPRAGDDGSSEEDEDRSTNPDDATKSLQDRMRALSSVEQQRVAATGGLTERTMLERVFGPSVWDALLRNPRITAPEVARIARKGTAPRPMLDAIAANAAWLASADVQRALLANPRTSLASATRVLQALPRGDLLRVPQQTAYPASVRQAAKKLLG